MTCEQDIIECEIASDCVEFDASVVVFKRLLSLPFKNFRDRWKFLLYPDCG